MILLTVIFRHEVHPHVWILRAVVERVLGEGEVPPDKVGAGVGVDGLGVAADPPVELVLVSLDVAVVVLVGVVDLGNGLGNNAIVKKY